MLQTQPTASCRLRREKQLRILEGHPWVYRSDIASYEGHFEPGDLMEVRDADGNWVGVGYVNPLSKITVRILTRQPDEIIDRAFFDKRITIARQLRERRAQNIGSYRLIFGSADHLPGLVVDRFEDYLVIQFLTLGMECFRDLILDVLIQQLRPRGIYEKSQALARAPEGLEGREGLLHGTVPEFIPIQLHGVTYLVDVYQGQKTGFFLDQRENRQAAARYVLPGDTVLDAYTNTGGFALVAASRGAEVLGLDASERAIEVARRAAALNFPTMPCRFERALLPEALAEFQDGSFDVVIVDPPAYTKSKHSARNAARNYRLTNAAAIRLVRRGGILISSSCSHHIGPERFLNILKLAAREASRELTFLEIRGQPWDHPVATHVPQSRYLKCVIARVL